MQLYWYVVPAGIAYIWYMVLGPPTTLYTHACVLGVCTRSTRTAILLPGLSVLYSTHVLMECLNLGVVVVVALLGMHSLVVCSRALYGSNLYLELV
jgi:hypothetical protein